MKCSLRYTRLRFVAERGTVWKTFLKLLEITDCIGKYKHYMSKLKEQIISESSANLR